MKEINDALLKECARNIMFELSDEDLSILKEDFEMVKGELAKIDKIEGLDEATPMTFPFTEVLVDTLREDDPVNLLTRDEALSNAKDVLGGQIRLPKVVK